MLDVGEREGGVELAEVEMGEVVENEAGGLEVGAFNYVVEGHNVGMAECAEDVVFAPDFIFTDGDQHLDGDALLGALVSALEDVGVLAPAELAVHHIVIHVAE